MNRAGLELEHYIENFREGEVVQTEISLKLSDSLVETGDGDYFSPNEQMRKDLMEVLGFDSIGFPAVQLRVVTQSGGDEQWRQIVIPEKMLKRHLGPIINIAFGRKSFEPYELLWNEAEKRGVTVVCTIQETPTYGFAQPPIDPASLSER